MTIAAWIDMDYGQRFLLAVGKWPVVIAYLVLFCLNFYALVGRGHGTRFEREFSHLERKRKILLLVTSGVLLAVIVVFLYYSICAYQRFFHIVPKGW